MRLLKLIIISSVFLIGAFWAANPSLASEGTVELRSSNDQDYRCFVASLLMENSKYKVLVSCRDLIYPPQPDLFTYIMWATPLGGVKAVKLGELGVGKADFETKDAFSNLFVTVEQNRNARTPSGQVVMSGNVQGISFLDRPTTPTPTPEGVAGEEEKPEEIVKAGQLSTKDKLILAMKRAGIIVFLGLVAVIGLIFVLTRPK